MYVVIVGSNFQLIQTPLTFTSFLPFCVAVGGIFGALWEYIRDADHRFPTGPSFRGAVYGTIFAVLVFVIGKSGTVEALRSAEGPHPRHHAPLLVLPAWVLLLTATIFLAVMTRATAGEPSQGMSERERGRTLDT
jgi:hypothetical protein